MAAERVPTSTTYVRPLKRSGPESTVVCLDANESGARSLADVVDHRTQFESHPSTDPAAIIDQIERQHGNVDCIVAANDLGSSTGIDLLHHIRADYPFLPFVLVVDEGSETLAGEVVNADADGYVIRDGHLSEDQTERLRERIETAVIRYRTRSSLEATARDLMRLTEFTSDVLWMCSADWEETIVVNDAYEDIWGRPVEGLIDDTSSFLEAVHPDHREMVEQSMAAVSTGESIDIEFQIDTGDETERWVNVHAEPVFDHANEVRYVAGFTRDITERRIRERRERESNERLGTLIQSLPVVITKLDPGGVITSAAGKGLQGLELEPDEFTGNSVFDVYGDHDDIVDAVGRALAGQEIRVSHEIKDRVFETWYRPVFDDGGNIDHVIGVARDMTEIKRRRKRVESVTRATQELPHARSEKEVANLIVEIAESIIGCPMTAYWRYEQEESALIPTTATVATLAARGVSDPEELPRIEPGTAEMDAFKSGVPKLSGDYPELDSPADQEHRRSSLFMLPLDGHGLLIIRATGSGVLDEFDRHLAEILGQSATNALDRVKREQELERQRTELERSNESLQQFAYVASHDLQEPLRMVASYVDLLDQEYGDELDDEAREYMEFAVDGAQRMQDMVDALLQYSRVQTRGQDFERVDSDRILEETLDSLQMRIEETGTTVTTDRLPAVEGDPNQLGQVFQNLLENAITYAIEDGVEPHIDLHGTETDEIVTFSISDNGPGIEMDDEERVFEIFKRGGAHDASGTGVGLSICRRIVRRHGGDMWIESTGDDGTTFQFTMPAAGTEGSADD